MASQATMTSFFSTQSTGNSVSLAEAGDRSPTIIRAPQERKRANPAPLGLCAFALTTFLFGCVQMRCKGVSRPDIIIAPALVYGGFIQLLSGMWEMANGNTFGATLAGSYGGFWISFAVIFISDGFHIEDSMVKAANGSHVMFNNALALYLMGWFIFTFLMMLCSTVKASIAMFVLILDLDVAVLLTALSYFYSASDQSPNEGLSKASGLLILLAAFIAWYNALAEMTREEGVFALPVGYFPWSQKKRELKLAQCGPDAVQV